MNKIIKLEEVIERSGLSRSTIYSYLADGKFPKQVKIGVRAVGWVESDINDWIETCISSSRQGDQE